MKNALLLSAALILLNPFSFAQETEKPATSSGIVPPAEIESTGNAEPVYHALLKKRVEAAEQYAEHCDTAHRSGSKDGSIPVLADAHIRLAEMRNKLYQATGEKKEQIAALESKVKWTKEKLQAVNAVVESGAAPRFNTADAELAVMEAEYELAEVKKNSAEKLPVKPLHHHTDKFPPENVQTGNVPSAEQQMTRLCEQISVKLDALQKQIDEIKSERQKTGKQNHPEL